MLVFANKSWQWSFSAPKLRVYRFSSRRYNTQSQIREWGRSTDNSPFHELIKKTYKFLN